MNSTQVQTTSATLIAAVAGYLAGAHVFNLSAGDWTTILGALVSVGAIVWPIIAARAQALKTQVGNLPNTTVVTDPESAKASPSPDVICATPKIVTAIKEAKASV